MTDCGSYVAREQRATQPDNGSTQEGQSVVELALFLPVLLFIMVGALDLGRAFHAYTTVVNAAREGARYGAFHPTDSVGIRNHVEQEAQGSGIDLSQSTVIVETPNISPGSPIKVTVIYQFQPITGLIVGGQTLSISGSVSMIQF
ncbi:MAG: pilus assembly protein [Chloroflexi bacterium]|nr:MAG: pilus assembly protein [Chloroflexota bacterium]